MTNENSNKSFKDIFSQPKVVWAVFFAAVISFMGLGLVDPILPVISQQLGATQTEVALLFTTYSAVMAIAMLVTDIVSAKLGIKKTLLLGVGIIAFFSWLCGYVNDIWTIIFLRIGWGLGNALFVAVALTAIINFSGGDNEGSIILYETAVGLGFSAGPLLGGILGNMLWKYPFYGVGALMVIGFILLLVLLPSSKKINESISQKEKEHHANKSIMDPFRLMKRKPVLILGIFGFLYNFGFFTLFAYSPFVLGLSAQGIGYVFLFWGILVAVSSIFIAPKIKNKLGTFKSIYLVIAILVLILFIMGLFTNNILILIVSIIVSGFLMGNVNTLLTNAMMKIGGDDRSTTSAAYNFIRFIGSAIAPLFATFVGEQIAPNVPFITGGLFMLTALIFLYLNKKHLPDVDNIFEKFEENIFKVKDFMVSNVIKILPNTKVIDVLQILDTNKISGLPVVDENNKLLDIITSGDIIRYLIPKDQAHDLLYSVYVEEESESDVIHKKTNKTAKDILNAAKKKKLVTLTDDDSFEKAMNYLSKHHFKIIPVIDNEEKVIGIVSRGDINNTFIKMTLNKEN